MDKEQMKVIHCNIWRKRAAELMGGETLPTLEAVEHFVTEASRVVPDLAEVVSLKENVKKAYEWDVAAKAMKEYDEYPYLYDLWLLVEDGKDIPIKLTHLPELNCRLTEARKWLNDCKNIFLTPHSNCLLIDALAPRTIVGIESIKYRKKRFRENLGKPMIHQISRHKFTGRVSIGEAYSAFRGAEHKEVKILRELRESNNRKFQLRTGATKFCFCQSGLRGLMFRCELCREWYHVECIRAPHYLKDFNAEVGISDVSGFEKFLCPCCVLTRRPEYEGLKKLLGPLGPMHVRIPEAEAMQILITRIMNWRERVDNYIIQNGLAALYKKTACVWVYLQNLTRNQCPYPPTEPETLPVLTRAHIADLQEFLWESHLFEADFEDVHLLWDLLKGTPPFQDRVQVFY